jgi:hypothetical protein
MPYLHDPLPLPVFEQPGLCGVELHAVSNRGGGIPKQGPQDWLSQTAGAAAPLGAERYTQ